VTEGLPPAEPVLRRLLRPELTCQECPKVWEDSETTRWRAYVVDEDPPQVLLFCPGCAAREFGC
jgi:hypothetical protein